MGHLYPKQDWSNVRLLIAIPTVDYVHAWFMRSLTYLVKRLAHEGMDFRIEIDNGSLIYMARNSLVQKAIGGGFTHVLWLDSDMVFDPFIVDHLLNVDADIVTAVCRARRKPYSYNLFETLDPPKKVTTQWSDIPATPFSIEGCGFACVLTRVEAIKFISEHYDNEPFRPVPQFGEDLAFCERAWRMGYSIMVQPLATVGHICHETVWPQLTKEDI